MDRDSTLVPISPADTQQHLNPTADATDVTMDGMATNEALNDDNTNQRLSTEEIEELKAKVDGKQLVERVIQGSDSFNQKNAFSQIKYVQRKQRKFLRWFVLRQATIRTLSTYYTKRDPRKVMDLRLDSLSQIICLSNCQAVGSRTLVWDETLGFLTGAILSKISLDSEACLVNVHPERQMQVPALMYFNLDETLRSRLHSLQLSTLHEPLDESFLQHTVVDEHRLAIQRERFQNRLLKKKTIRTWLDNSLFDTLIIATKQISPLDIIAALRPCLRPSAKLVVYSSWRELLLPTYADMRRDAAWIDVNLTESWLRPYQSAPGRIHPEMTCNGNTGTILSATLVTVPQQQ